MVGIDDEQIITISIIYVKYKKEQELLLGDHLVLT